MTEKVYINSFNMATFRCPKCDKTRTMNVSKYKDIETAVKVNCKCPCGHAYSVLLERRKHLRTEIKLHGTYQCLEREERGVMTVTDISRSGMRIKLSVIKKLKLGERLRVTFNLDDEQRSLIKREVVIRSISGLFVGVEFTSENHYDQLGPYLLYSLN